MTARSAAIVFLLVGTVMISACGTTGGPAPVKTGVLAKPAAPAAEVAPGEGQTPDLDALEAEVGEYRLGPGDVVKITVYNNPDLSMETEITQTGRISFPLIGQVVVGGLTRSRAEKAISDSLGKGGFVPNAHVNLLVMQYRSRQVSVMGEVNKPGTYPITKPTNVTELLAMAGGVTAKGSNLVTVIQRDEAGNTKRHEIDVRRLLSGNLSSTLVDKDDIIFVPVAPVFYIYGEVRQPGSYPLAPDMTVRQALSLGGGLTVRGTERGIRLERRGKDNDTISRRPNLNDKLQPNDVLHVPEGWF